MRYVNKRRLLIKGAGSLLLGSGSASSAKLKVALNNLIDGVSSLKLSNSRIGNSASKGSGFPNWANRISSNDERVSELGRNKQRKYISF